MTDLILVHLAGEDGSEEVHGYWIDFWDYSQCISRSGHTPQIPQALYHELNMIFDLSKYDFRLLEVESELYALEDHLKLIESQLEQSQRKERLRLDTRIRTQRLSPEDPEWHEAIQHYYERIEFLLPRFFRGPFLVALYAVYESAVTEIAQIMQKKSLQGISIKDLRGDFLKRAKKYYKHILNFDLYTEEKAWQRISMLAELRNAFAHVNGRMEMLNENSRTKIKGWENQKTGIATYSGYIVCDAKIVEEIFQNVRESLENLMNRYKNWDDIHA
jgi:hypothetical protein